VVLLAGLGIPAMAQPKADTVRGFERYGAVAEARIRAEQSSAGGFLRINALGGAERRQAEFRLRRGEVLIVRVGPAPEEVPGGLIHDWVGTAYLPETTIAQVLAAVQDYDHIAEHYRPEVEASRLISRQGDDFKVFLRLRKHKLVTVVLDTEYDVHYGRLDEAHWFSTSHSTRIDEVGGGDHGYLWRLNTYWRFAEAGDGVMVQCEAISLTRDIPTGLGWMIGPFVSNLPRESLTFTLEATRRAVAEAAKTRVIPTRGNALARDDR
jgi:hypothetical protein